jgi:DNA-binding NtrC family response regulator
LKVITLKIPLLRERKEDIPILTRYFLDLFCKENNTPTKEISNEAMNILVQQPWEGNVRELKNLIESLVVLSRKDRLDVSDIPLEYRQGHQKEAADSQFAAGMTMAEVEKLAIMQTLEKTGGNRSKAAEILGIGLRTLQRKLKEYRGESAEAEQSESDGEEET